MTHPATGNQPIRGADFEARTAHAAPTRRIAYYPGCSLDGLAVEYDRSTRAVCAALGIELATIPDWNCCGSTPAHSLDPDLSAALAGRNLALAEQNQFDLVMTPCPGCLRSLKGALAAYHHPEQQPAFLDLLGMPFKGSVRTVSLLQLLSEEAGRVALQERVSRPLTGLVLAPYYGCLLTRPASFAEFDDPENPTTMDRLLQAAGATVPAFPYKTECCGATYGVTRNDIVGRLSGRILDMALRVGARAIVTACPLCQQNLDLRQHQVERFCKKSYNIPVLYLSQVIGLALGLDPSALGMELLMVNADGILAGMTGFSPHYTVHE
jgi:heterodisulfide reductase subunit B2